MSNFVKLVMEGASAGKIEKQTALHLLKLVKQEESRTASNEIAIIGLSVRTSLAADKDEFWNGLASGQDAVRTFPPERRGKADRTARLLGLNGDYAQAGYLEEIDRFDPAFFRLSPREASLMNPDQRLFLQAAWEAIEDAGYGEQLAGSRTGVYVGVNAMTSNQYMRLIEAIEPEASDQALVGNIPAMIASRISYLLDFRGPSMTIDTACSSSLVAVHQACAALRNRECDVAIAGAAKTEVMPLSTLGADLGVDSSDGRARTFDSGSDGTGGGEGVIALVLKPLKKL